jgi:signal peptidase II
MKNASSLRHLVLFAVIAVAGCAGVLHKKSGAFHQLGPPSHTQTPRIIIPGAFSLLTSVNTGALFGVWQGGNVVFAVASTLAVAGILTFVLLRRPAGVVQAVALGLVMAGAMGNLYDRLGLHGLKELRTGEVHAFYLPFEAPDDSAVTPVYAVRDFLYFKIENVIDWPIFNFADVFLVTGASLLILPSLFRPATESTDDGAETVQTPVRRPHSAPGVSTAQNKP